MKKFVMGLIIAIILLIVLAVGLYSTLDNFYQNSTHVDSTVQPDEKYVVYLYREDDLYSQNLLPDVQKFSGLLSENNIGFYLIDLNDKKDNPDEKFYVDNKDGGDLQSGTDYPVTPEQVNDLGVENFVVAGAPDIIYVDSGQVKRVGVGVQTSTMGNSYISVQDTMKSIAEDNGIDFTPEYEYGK